LAETGLELTVIVPAYRDGESIVPTLASFATALDEASNDWEIVVVADGDAATFAAASPLESDRVHVHGYRVNRGKGFALRYGISLARGRLVTFLDSDGEIDPVDIRRMVGLLRSENADIVVGSKRHPQSHVDYPWTRRVQSACYQAVVRLLLNVGVRDTQTGLKVMRREVALAVLDVALVKRFAFDVELLALARHFGYTRILEAPVTINYKFSSTTDMGAVFRVLWDTAAIFYRLRLRRWYNRPEARGLADLRAAMPARLGPD
jgi:glycosyltransferase involved in cell wall biosynthesis